MTLTAESISASILPDLSAIPRSGSVHSVFSRTVNILCDDMTWLSLHPSGTPMHPYAVTVPVESFVDVATGDPVTLCRSHIALGRQALAIDLRRAELWDPSLSPLSDVSKIDCACLLDTLKDLSGTGPVTSPFLAVISGNPLAATDTWSRALSTEAAGIVDCIEVGLRVSSRQLVLGGIRRAVGLGPGFTPSGDDYLTGLVGAYWYFAPGDQMGETLLAGMVPVMHRTSLPSFFMLKGALRGHFPEPLTGLLHALGRAREADVAGTLRCLTGTGAASGEDMLAGLLTYLGVGAGVGGAYAAN